jgi:hypothetical protein
METGRKGKRPIHYLLSKRRDQLKEDLGFLISIFVKYGADLTAETHSGRNVLDYALKKRGLKYVPTLLNFPKALEPNSKNEVSHVIWHN